MHNYDIILDYGILGSYRSRGNVVYKSVTVKGMTERKYEYQTQTKKKIIKEKRKYKETYNREFSMRSTWLQLCLFTHSPSFCLVSCYTAKVTPES